MKEKLNKNHKAVLDALLLQEEHVNADKMFDYPAYYAGRKLCVCLYGQGVGVKVPETTAAALLERDKNTG